MRELTNVHPVKERKNVENHKDGEYVDVKLPHQSPFLLGGHVTEFTTFDGRVGMSELPLGLHIELATSHGLWRHDGI